ncbi:ArsR/SmtB family transcription factor [Sphingopyxis panaciterrae]
MHAFDILGDPVRRRILELLAHGTQSSGEIVGVIAAEFGISQPAVSQHLRILRDSGFATARADGRRRLYAVAPERFDEVDAWVQRFRRTWEPRFEALATEVSRGKKARQEKNSVP